MAVRAVIFDWGGTLTPWHLVDHDSLWRSACAPHFPAERVAEVAAAILAAERDLWQATGRSHRSATLAEVFERAGVPATEGSWPATSRRWSRIPSRTQRLRRSC